MTWAITYLSKPRQATRLLHLVPLILCLALLTTTTALSQSVDSLAPTLYKATEAPVELEKKRLPSNHFYGLRVKKARLRYGSGKNKIIEVFYHLKAKHTPKRPPYVPYVYWYHLKDKEIRYSRTYNPQEGFLLHGRYQKLWRKQVIEERFFYHGVRHGRWTRLNKNNILLSKNHYHKGWSKAAVIRYYDLEQTQIYEVVPHQGEHNKGYYYAFHPNGKVAVVGNYVWSKKVGIWKEYYPNGQKKREVNYGKNPHDDSFTPYIVKEWHADGTTLYFYETLPAQATNAH